jgi:hypothetical protein
MTDPTNYIDGLLQELRDAQADGYTLAGSQYAALSALVAERDALRMRVAELTGDLNVLVADRSVSTERLDAAKKRIAELESQPPADRDRELRERPIESALRGVNVSGLHRSEAELMRTASVWMVDAAIAAMRKGEA